MQFPCKLTIYNEDKYFYFNKQDKNAMQIEEESAFKGVLTVVCEKKRKIGREKEGEEKPPEKPHPGNLSRPGIEPGPAAVTGAHATICPTAVDGFGREKL